MRRLAAVLATVLALTGFHIDTAHASAPATPTNYYGYWDLSSSEAQSYITSQLTAAGITAAAYPSLYDSLAAATTIYANANAQGIIIPNYYRVAEENDLDPVQTTVPSYNASSSTIAATIASTIPDNPYSVTNTIALFNGNTQLGGVAGNITVGGTTVASTAQNQTVSGVTDYAANGIVVYVVPASELGQAATALGLSSSDSVALAMPVSTTISTSSTGTSITNNQPTDVNGDDEIMLCVGRTGTNCDYDVPSINLGVLMPINGSISYPSTIATNPTTGAPTYMDASVAIWYPEVGGGCEMADADFANAVTVTGNVLTWNATPASFGSICSQYPYGTTVSVTYQLTVTVQNTSGGLMSATVTTDQTASPSSTTLVLLPMEFVYGCVAEGTLITMADGTSTAIEKVQPKQTVRGGDGRKLEVRAYWKGDESELIRVKTQNGKTVSISSGHPLPLADGTVKLGSALAVGDKLTTSDGTSAIATLEKVRWTGKVWNLDLGAPRRPNQAPALADHGFFANGILIGDGRAQVYYNKVHKESADQVKARLPASWHRDYDSAAKRK